MPAAVANTTDSPVRIAYSYRRWSTGRQRDGHSLARQTEAASRRAELNGYKLDLNTIAPDDGVSAFHGANAVSGNLGAFLTAVRIAQMQPGSALVVENLDRVSRDQVDEAAFMLSSICKLGIDVVDLSGRRVYSRDTFMREPFAFIEMALGFIRANSESVVKSARVRDARARNLQAAAQGNLFTAMLPQWLKAPTHVVGTRRLASDIEVIEDRAAIVRSIFESFVAGEGQHGITNRLNTEAVPCWTQGGRWTRSYVQKLLRTPAVIGSYALNVHERVDGVRRYKQVDTIDGYLPRIVSDELWHAAQARLKETQPRGKAANQPVLNLLQGVCRCNECGATMGTRSSCGCRCVAFPAAFKFEPHGRQSAGRNRLTAFRQVGLNRRGSPSTSEARATGTKGSGGARCIAQGELGSFAHHRQPKLPSHPAALRPRFQPGLWDPKVCASS